MQATAVVPERLVEPVDPALLRSGEAVVILGAGAAGLALAAALVRSGWDRPVLLLDERTAYPNDRTWCFWSADGDPAARLATAAWHEWIVRTDGMEVRRHQRGIAYRRVRGIDQYGAWLAELGQARGVHLRLGERILGLDERAGEPPVVRTASGTVVPGVLVDCRGPRLDPERVAAAKQGGVWLGQEFLGQRIRADRPVFDSSAAVLLDFRIPQDVGVRFTYVLPTSPTEALVESVRFAPDTRIDAAAHRRLLTEHLRQAHGLLPGEVTVLDEERGCIPMTDTPADPVRGPRHYALGLGAGAARPSTGYAFLRILRSADETARAVVEGREPRLELDGWRRRLLDAVFLRYLLRHPTGVPDVFVRMFARTPPAALLRFLGDASTPADELLLIAALPKAPFLAILGRLAVERLRPTRRPRPPRIHVVPRRLG